MTAQGHEQKFDLTRPTPPPSRPISGKTPRRRRQHLRRAARNLQHRQPALIGAVRLEAEDAVGAVEAGRIGEHALRIALRALAAREGDGERHRVIGERRCAPDRN
jgi:hypothetical protein